MNFITPEFKQSSSQEELKSTSFNSSNFFSQQVYDLCENEGDKCPSCDLNTLYGKKCISCKLDLSSSKDEIDTSLCIVNKLNLRVNLFNDIVYEDIEITVRKIEGKNCQAYIFNSCGINFEIVLFGKTAAYFAEGQQFHISELSNDYQNALRSMKGKIHISQKGKLKETTPLYGEGSTKYLKNLPDKIKFNFYDTFFIKIKGQYLDIENQISKSTAQIHLLIGGYYYKYDISYTINKGNPQDGEINKSASDIKIDNIYKKHNNYWKSINIDKDKEATSKDIIFAILNNSKFNPYIIS